MSDEQRPGDPADRAADGAFGGIHSHRAGYGHDKLARLIDWVRERPTATLASGEGALLLAEIDRLRDDLQKQADWADWAKGEMDRLTRILAALQEPSEALFIDGYNAGYDDRKCENDYDPYGRLPDVAEIIRAAVAAAEQEVGRE